MNGWAESGQTDERIQNERDLSFIQFLFSVCFMQDTVLDAESDAK